MLKYELWFIVIPFHKTHYLKEVYELCTFLEFTLRSVPTSFTPMAFLDSVLVHSIQEGARRYA